MFSRFLAPDIRRRRRPLGMTHAIDEIPSTPAALLLAGQHAALALALVAQVVAAAQGAGVGAEETRTLVVGTALAMGLGTLLQALGGRFGAGATVVHGAGPFALVLAVATLKAGGPAALVFLTFLDGAVRGILAPLARRARAIFPPTVVGVVVCLGGLGLIPAAASSALGMAGHGPDGGANAAALVIALASLGAMVALSVWGGPRGRSVALVAGVAVGGALSVVLGLGPDPAVLGDAPLFALPNLVFPREAVDPWVLLSLVPVVVLSAVNGLGVFVLMDRMDDADWRRVDMEAVAKGTRATGVANGIGAFLGAMPTEPNPANVGLCHATRASSRGIGLLTGLMIGALAFLPGVTAVLVALPEPVLGAVLVYAAAYLITSGMEMILSRDLDSRATFMVGTAAVVGVGFTLVPEAGAMLSSLPGGVGIHPMVAGGVVAIALNALFRIGTKNRVRLEPPPETGGRGQDVVDLLEYWCGRWNARRDVTQRAILSVMEGVEVLRERGRPLVALEGSFDEFNLDWTLVHGGPPLEVGRAVAPDWTKALEGDDADLEATMDALSAVVLRNLANSVKAERGADGQSRFTLHFQH
jgi:xanthine/uracil permease